MASVSAERVNARGKSTGTATLHVDRNGEFVYVGLGLITVRVPADIWARLIGESQPLAVTDSDGDAAGIARIAALRILAGKRNWADAEALADAAERMTRPGRGTGRVYVVSAGSAGSMGAGGGGGGTSGSAGTGGIGGGGASGGPR